ncbi:MAG: Esterase/lipase [Rhodobacteraceae bacterium HLUCCA08]|nr:MAG: Esterase/lipase [Rhodobacteraceae bacterium HLUCCA08]
MSWRLRALTMSMRLFAKPRLRRTREPQNAFRDFERAAPLLFSRPRGLRHAVEQGPPRLNWYSVGPVRDDALVFFVHGGAFVCGNGHSYAALAGRLSQRSGMRVCLPEYRLLQEAPFPAATEDLRTAWEAVCARGHDPSRIAIAGDSAGGNLALTLLWQLLAEGIRPAAFLGFSPWADLTLSGESLSTNRRADPILPRERMEEVIARYLNGADPSDPRCSPLLAAFPDPPPALIQVGAEEILLSDAERMAEKLGAELTVWPGCPHVWQIFDPRLPEARAAMKQAGRFLQTSFDAAMR